VQIPWIAIDDPQICLAHEQLSKPYLSPGQGALSQPYFHRSSPMIRIVFLAVFAAGPSHGLAVVDSAVRDVDLHRDSTPVPSADIGPRVHGMGVGVRPLSSDELRLSAPVDTGAVSPRSRAIEYSDAYYTRLTIHRIASYTELPLFGAEYVLGERLLHDESTETPAQLAPHVHSGYPPASLKEAHLAVAGGLGVLFGLNTVTGLWNLWDSRQDPVGRTRRIVHSVAMLGADAGFALAGAVAGGASHSLQGAQRHRTIALGSMALATAGSALMWFWHN
jgi:hypothetical protein